MKLKKRIKKIFKYFGYDLVKLKGSLGKGTFENELVKIINSISIDLVLDIGANKGQFAKSLIDFGYEDKILSFEPIDDVYNQLKKESIKYENWLIYQKCCVGKSDGVITLNISNLKGNSSILNIKSTKYNVDQSHYIAREKVKTITLETLNENEFIKNAKNIFIKMDIQGFEHEVLTKLPEVNYNVLGFYIELSLVELYDEQKDYLYICNQLKDFGYDLVYIEPESIRSNRMIQFNGVFLHNTISF